MSMRRKYVGLLFGCLAWSTSAFAQGGKVAVLDVARAIQQCAEGKQAIEEFQKKVDAKRAELERKTSEVQELQKQLQSQSRTLNDDSRNALSKTIETKNTELQRAQQDAQKEFGDMQAEIINRIGNKLAPFVQQYAKEHSFALIVDSSNQATQLVYWDPAIEITDDIIKRYDAGRPVPPAGPAAGVKPPTPPADSGAKKP